MTDQQTAEGSIGSRLIAARERAGFTVAQLARRLGVQTRTLSAWERDQSEPRSNRLLMLAGMLGVSATWLLQGIGEGIEESSADAEIERIRADVAELRGVAERMIESLDTMDARLSDLSERLAGESGDA